MKQKEIDEIVSNHLHGMDGLFHKIATGFDLHDIHDFRVEVKKLRAFLRLLNADHEPDKPVIPKRLKTFYGYVGNIRNIQLHRNNFLKYYSGNNIERPQEYCKMLDTEEDYWRKEVSAWQQENAMENNESKIMYRMPHKLEASTLKKFTSNKLDELNDQLHDISNDEAMHEVRKILKDLLYTRDYMNEDADVPEAIAKKDDLKKLTALLGDFMDQCIQIGFLSHEYVNSLKSANEKISLNEFKGRIMDEKRATKQQITPHFNALAEQLCLEH